MTCFKGKSRNYIKGILKRGQIKIDGIICTDYSRPLHSGQQVEVLLKAHPANGKITLPIIHEDDDIIVIDKPAGVLSISTDKEHENTVYHIVNSYMKSGAKFGHVFIVHRLDRDTSGVMLLAKNERIKFALQEDWNNTVIKRGYAAVVEGKVHPNEGKITSWLKQTKTLKVYSSDRADDGKIAITNYSVLKTGDKYTLLDISLETGRKAQIRVHMSDMGNPIAGDKKYGARTDPFGRLALHANILVITHPTTGETIKFDSPIPSVFTKVFGC